MDNFWAYIWGVFANATWDAIRYFLGGSIVITSLIGIAQKFRSGKLDWVILGFLFVFSFFCFFVSSSSSVSPTIASGQSKTAPPPFPVWPNPYRPISVVKKEFRNTEVILDGYSYEGCTFENVTFVYNGTTPPQLRYSTIVRSVTLRSDNLAVTGAVSILKGLGMLPALNIDLGKEGNILEEPITPSDESNKERRGLQNPPAK